LRFDYFGTGDSPGEDDEGNLDLWTDDVLRADDEVVRRSGCPRSAWFGLRLGASLAALASKRAGRGPRRLILWDPVVDGSAYLAELASAHIRARKEDFGLRWQTESRLRSMVATETRTEAIGYPLTPNLRAQLGALSLSSFKGIKAERLTLLGAKADLELAELQGQLASSGIDVRTRTIDSNITWTDNEILNDSIVLPQDVQNLALVLTEA
jgi:pimeloyl-ACP methyl ester carboxylesterase